MTATATYEPDTLEAGTVAPAASPACASFARRQGELLRYYGLKATSRYVDLEEPPILGFLEEQA